MDDGDAGFLAARQPVPASKLQGVKPIRNASRTLGIKNEALFSEYGHRSKHTVRIFIMCFLEAEESSSSSCLYILHTLGNCTRNFSLNSHPTIQERSQLRQIMRLQQLPIAINPFLQVLAVRRIILRHAERRVEVIVDILVKTMPGFVVGTWTGLRMAGSEW